MPLPAPHQKPPSSPSASGTPFTEWRPPAALADAIRKRWPAMRVVHLPEYDRLPQELPDTDIFVGYSLRAQQLLHAKKLQWIHSTAAA